MGLELPTSHLLRYLTCGDRDPHRITFYSIGYPVPALLRGFVPSLVSARFTFMRKRKPHRGSGCCRPGRRGGASRYDFHKRVIRNAVEGVEGGSVLQSVIGVCVFPPPFEARGWYEPLVTAFANRPLRLATK